MPVKWEQLSSRQVLKAETRAYEKWVEEYTLAYPGKPLPPHKVTEPRSEPKLVPSLGSHVEEGLHVANLKYLCQKLHVRIRKVLRVWRFRQQRYLKPIFDEMTQRRAATLGELAKAIIKLTMNANYGKMLQNQLGQTNVRYYTNSELWGLATWRRNVEDYEIVYHRESTGEFLGWVSFKSSKGVMLNTLRLQGWATLEWAKVVMMQLHYDVFKAHFGPAAKLLFTDTDSFIYHITLTDELLRHFDLDAFDPCIIEVEHLFQQYNLKFEPVFDLCKAGNKTYKGRVGFAKLEIGGKQMLIEFYGAQAKMYALKIYTEADGDEDSENEAGVEIYSKMKAKGLKKKLLRRECALEDFVTAIFDRQTPARLLHFLQMRSNEHRMEHWKTAKIGITAFNDKVRQVGPNDSRAIGHWRNALAENLDDDRDELWVRPL
jgi:hypothetical protein